MVIDIHTHTFPERIAARAVSALAETSHITPQTDATCAGLLSSMEKAGVDLSVILPVATSPRQVETINNSAAETNRRYAGKLFSLGGMHPGYENWYEELARIRDLGLKGIKIHPVYQGTDIDDPAYIGIFKRCAGLGLFVITHSGDDIGFPGTVHCSPEMCLHVKEQVPSLTLVCAHMGGWQTWEKTCELLADTDILIDTAFSLHPVHPLDDHWKDDEPALLSVSEFERMVRLFGAERVLFGTDCPWADQKEYAKLISSMDFCEEERRMILGGNAERLLGL